MTRRSLNLDEVSIAAPCPVGRRLADAVKRRVRAAQVHKSARRFAEAARSYELAIKAFREDKGKYDHKFEMTVAREYSQLLRQQKHSAKANLIEKEFCSVK